MAAFSEEELLPIQPRTNRSLELLSLQQVGVSSALHNLLKVGSSVMLLQSLAVAYSEVALNLPIKDSSLEAAINLCLEV